jgi:glycerate kinase
MSAAEAAAAICAGWAKEAPDDVLDLAPVSDGGPGFVTAMASALTIALRDCEVAGPRGERVIAQYALDEVTGTAYVESAQAAGLHLIPVAERDPGIMTSWGVGELLVEVVKAGAGRVVVGLGGTGICDGGAGLLAALGATAVDDRGADVTQLLRGGGIALSEVAEIDLSPSQSVMAGVEIVVASDVDCPLLGTRGAARGFAAQKGASPAEVDVLEEALTTWSMALGAIDMQGVSKQVGVLLGAGAGGGIGAALFALGATRKPGIDYVLTASEMSRRAQEADLVLTGEGSFDWQSLRGKAISGVAQAALAAGRPVVVLAGRVEVGRREWAGIGVSGVYSLADLAGSAEIAISDGPRWLTEAAARAARSWSRGLQVRS